MTGFYAAFNALLGYTVVRLYRDTCHRWWWWWWWCWWNLHRNIHL